MLSLQLQLNLAEVRPPTGRRNGPAQGRPRDQGRGLVAGPLDDGPAGHRGVDVHLHAGDHLTAHGVVHHPVEGQGRLAEGQSHHAEGPGHQEDPDHQGGQELGLPGGLDPQGDHLAEGHGLLGGQGHPGGHPTEVGQRGEGGLQVLQGQDPGQGPVAEEIGQL